MTEVESWQFCPEDFTIADLWLAYRRGARESRDAAPQPTDEQIERACDAYCKLILLSRARANDYLPDAQEAS